MLNCSLKWSITVRDIRYISPDICLICWTETRNARQAGVWSVLWYLSGAQWLSGRMPYSQSREPWFESPLCYHFKVWAFLFYPRRHSARNCSLASSQRSRNEQVCQGGGGCRVNALSSPTDWIMRYIKTYLFSYRVSCVHASCQCLSQDLDFSQKRSYLIFLGSYLQKRGVIHSQRKLRDKARKLRERVRSLYILHAQNTKIVAS